MAIELVVGDRGVPKFDGFRGTADLPPGFVDELNQQLPPKDVLPAGEQTIDVTPVGTTVTPEATPVAGTSPALPPGTMTGRAGDSAVGALVLLVGVPFLLWTAWQNRGVARWIALGLGAGVFYLHGKAAGTYRRTIEFEVTGETSAPPGLELLAAAGEESP